MCSGVRSTGELPPGTVLGLTVEDPRLALPSRKVKASTRRVKEEQGNIGPRGARSLSYPNDEFHICAFSPPNLPASAEAVTAGTRAVLCSGGPLPGHADVPGSNPGRTLFSNDTLSD